MSYNVKKYDINNLDNLLTTLNIQIYYKHIQYNYEKNINCLDLLKLKETNIPLEQLYKCINVYNYINICVEYFGNQKYGEYINSSKIVYKNHFIYDASLKDLDGLTDLFYDSEKKNIYYDVYFTYDGNKIPLYFLINQLLNYYVWFHNGSGFYKPKSGEKKSEEKKSEEIMPERYDLKKIYNEIFKPIIEKIILLKEPKPEPSTEEKRKRKEEEERKINSEKINYKFFSNIIYIPDDREDCRTTKININYIQKRKQDIDMILDGINDNKLPNFEAGETLNFSQAYTIFENLHKYIKLFCPYSCNKSEIISKCIPGGCITLSNITNPSSKKITRLECLGISNDKNGLIFDLCIKIKSNKNFQSELKRETDYRNEITPDIINLYKQVREFFQEIIDTQNIPIEFKYKSKEESSKEPPTASEPPPTASEPPKPEPSKEQPSKEIIIKDTTNIIANQKANGDEGLCGGYSLTNIRIIKDKLGSTSGDSCLTDPAVNCIESIKITEDEYKKKLWDVLEDIRVNMNGFKNAEIHKAILERKGINYEEAKKIYSGEKHQINEFYGSIDQDVLEKLNLYDITVTVTTTNLINLLDNISKIENEDEKLNYIYCGVFISDEKFNNEIKQLRDNPNGVLCFLIAEGGRHYIVYCVHKRTIVDKIYYEFATIDSLKDDEKVINLNINSIVVLVKNLIKKCITEDFNFKCMDNSNYKATIKNILKTRGNFDSFLNFILNDITNHSEENQKNIIKYLFTELLEHTYAEQNDIIIGLLQQIRDKNKNLFTKTLFHEVNIKTYNDGTYGQREDFRKEFEKLFKPFKTIQPKIEGVKIDTSKIPMIIIAEYVFVFDFDLTLTTTHSSGKPEIGSDYFTETQLENVKQMFTKIKNNGDGIIILTRGNKNMIDNYLKQDKYKNDIYDKINCILGADNNEEIGSDTRADKMKWAKIKTEYLHAIQNENPNATILFYDDTQENVDEAMTAEFESYIVKKNTGGDTHDTTNVWESVKKKLKEIYPDGVKGGGKRRKSKRKQLKK